MPSDETRDSLLDAAKRVIQRDGVGHLTLDAVAREAGVSKGGLLYHFPNKQSLLRGMLEAGGRHIRRDLDAQMQEMPGPHSFARAFLKFSIFGPPEAVCKPSSKAIWSIIGATANDPSLLTPIRETHAEFGRRLSEERIDPDVANLMRLVGRGLWMTEIFGLDAPSEPELWRLHDLIADMGGLPKSHDGRESNTMEEI